MRKIHLVLNKEALEIGRHPDACAIVLDIIFATSSITAALDAGVHRIFPALNLAEAQDISKGLAPGRWVLTGEENAEPFANCPSYDPITLSQPGMSGKDLIYATTNGTVALRRASFFKHTYAASLRNGLAVIQHVLAQTGSDPIVLICSGSAGRFSLEDFYGAGYLVHCLRQCSPEPLQYSDAALVAEMAFQNTPPDQAIAQARLARLMEDRGLASSLSYVSQINCSAVVPQFMGDCIHDAAACRQPNITAPAGLP